MTAWLWLLGMVVFLWVTGVSPEKPLWEAVRAIPGDVGRWWLKKEKVMDEIIFVEPVQLMNEVEERCWIAVYAANSDNDLTTAEAVAEAADEAVRQLRKRVP